MNHESIAIKKNIAWYLLSLTIRLSGILKITMKYIHLIVKFNNEIVWDFEDYNEAHSLESHFSKHMPYVVYSTYRDSDSS